MESTKPNITRLTPEEIDIAINSAIYDTTKRSPEEMEYIRCRVATLTYNPRYKDCFDRIPGRNLLEQAIKKIQCHTKYGTEIV